MKTCFAKMVLVIGMAWLSAGCLVDSNPQDRAEDDANQTFEELKKKPKPKGSCLLANGTVCDGQSCEVRCSALASQDGHCTFGTVVDRGVVNGNSCCNSAAQSGAPGGMCYNCASYFYCGYSTMTSSPSGTLPSEADSTPSTPFEQIESPIGSLELDANP